MSTSDRNNAAAIDTAHRTMRTYLVLSIATAVFSGVYELFSHDVLSANMICAFLYPLLLGALPAALLWTGLRRNTRHLPGKAVRTLWNCGAATLTVGSLVSGALTIYGTKASFSTAYWIVGPVLLGLGLLLAAAEEHGRRKRVQEQAAQRIAEK